MLSHYKTDILAQKKKIFSKENQQNSYKLMIFIWIDVPDFHNFLKRFKQLAYF